MTAPAPCWLFGKRIVQVNARTGKRKVWWVARWLTHPCADLAVPFELGAVAALALLPVPPPPDPACAVPVPFHCDPKPAT